MKKVALIENLLNDPNYSTKKTNEDADLGTKVIVHHISKKVDKDDYKKGVEGNPQTTLSKGISIKTTLGDIVNKIAKEYALDTTFENWTLQVEDECNFNLIYRRSENKEGNEASSFELEAFSDGKGELWDAEYFFKVSIIGKTITKEELEKEFKGKTVNDVSEDKGDDKSKYNFIKLNVDGRDLHLTIIPRRDPSSGYGRKRKGSNTEVCILNGTSTSISFIPTEFHQFLDELNKHKEEVKEIE
jgi:hypothetical protein